MEIKIDRDLQTGINILEREGDIDRALKLINKSAKTGETKGKSFYEVAKIIREGVPGLQPNPEESKRYADAAMGHFMRGERDYLDYRYMGDYYYYGYGSEPLDYNKALELYDKGEELGDPISAEKASEIRKKLSDTKLVPNAALNRQTNVSFANAQPGFSVGIPEAPSIITDFEPVKTTNPKVNSVIDAEQYTIKAIQLLDDESQTKEAKLDGLEMAKQAASLGSIRALNLLGYIYETENDIVDQDLLIAKGFYEKAIATNPPSSVALFRLGLMLLDTKNPFFDIDKAHNLILRSARGGYSIALCYLGDCFREKVSDPRNLDLAYRYYAMAGERGYGLAYHYMAEIDSSRRQLGLAQEHERLAIENGYDTSMGYQDPLFMSLHI